MTVSQPEINAESAVDRLPYWARSTNPIVRRHLGLYWRTIPPQIRTVMQIIGVWMSILLVSLLIPAILDITSTLVVVSVMAVPVAMVLYGHVLVSIAIYSAQAMSEELRNKTMSLLMATPMSLEQILLGKAAAAIWKRMDDVMLVIYLAAVFGMPLLIPYYLYLWSTDNVVVSFFLLGVALIVSMIRLILEPLMVGMMGVLIGAFVPYRSVAITSTITMGGFYFLFLNLARYIPSIQDNLLLLLVIDLVVPVVLPLLIMWGALRYTSYAMLND